MDFTPVTQAVDNTFSHLTAESNNFVPRIVSHAFGGKPAHVDGSDITGVAAKKERMHSILNLAFVAFNELKDKLPFMNSALAVFDKIPGFSWANRFVSEHPIAGEAAFAYASPSTYMLSKAVKLGKEAVTEGGYSAIVDVIKGVTSGQADMAAIKAFAMFLMKFSGALGLGYHAQRGHENMPIIPGWGLDNHALNTLYGVN